VLSPQQIDHHRTLLTTARAHLAVLLNQQLTFGAYVPPHIVTEIARYRADIARMKQVLRDAGESVDDAPGDGVAAGTTDAGNPTTAGSTPPVARSEHAIPVPPSPRSSAPSAVAASDTPRVGGRDVSTAVVRITSADAENTDFGTGFVIAHDAAENGTFVVTCAHVVRSVNPAPMIYNLPATIVAIDQSERIDLAVLHVTGLGEIAPLETQQLEREDYAVSIPGWARYGKHPRLLPIDARLDRKTYIGGITPHALIDAWALTVPDTYLLERGYSGSPVIDPINGRVVAVANLAETNGKRGMAVSINALPLVWQDMPATLRIPSQVLTPDPVLPPVPPTVQVYLAAHQRLRGMASGRSGETVIDWTQLFASDDPGPSTWEQQLIPDLERHMHAFLHAHQKRIILRADARNTAGLVFGYVFCERAGFHIEYTGHNGNIWRTDDTMHGPSPVNRSETTIRKRGTDTIVELAITQGAPSVQRPVDAWITTYRPSVQKRIMLDLPRKPPRITPAEGSIIAGQVCDIISDEAIPGGTVHLFGAMPLGVALLIGWGLKAGRTIQGYELDPNQRYMPTCRVQT